MKVAAVWDKLDDLLNPIVVKELRQVVRSRVIMAALILFLIVQLGILLFNLSFDERRGVDYASLHAGRRIFTVFQGILLGTCMLLVPTYAGIRLSSEHSETNVDLLFISTLRPRDIMAGKLQASIVLILLIFSACAPFMTFTYLMRGIDIPSIVLVLLLDFLVVLFGTQGALFLGSIPTNLGLRLFLGLSGLVALFFVFITAMGGSITVLELGLGSRMDTLDFWLGVGGTAIVLVASIGQFFTWAVSIISSPSSNRAFPSRLYFLIFWLVTGVVAAVISYRAHEISFFLIWTFSVTILLCLQFLVSINERQQWGLRVMRMIPRNRLLRLPALLLYSGSAGGILFVIGMTVLTYGLTYLVMTYDGGTAFPRSTYRLDAERRLIAAFGLIALYTIDYCLMAVWLRNVLMPARVKASHTWIVSLLLFAIGFSLPLILVFMFQNEEWRMGQVDPWCYISNPCWTLYTVVESRGANADEFLTGSVVFLSVLGFLLLMGCMPWIVRQFVRFHPPLTTSVEKS
jgi:hypothetical protein